MEVKASLSSSQQIQSYFKAKRQFYNYTLDNELQQ